MERGVAMQGVWNVVRRSFLAGLLVILPVFVTVQVVVFVFTLLDRGLGKALNALLQSWVPGWDAYVPGIGLVASLALIVAVGWFTRYLFFKRLVEGLENFLTRIPVVRSVYNATKQFLDLIRGGGAMPFRQVVMIEYPMPGRWTMGLLAREEVDDGHDGREDLVVVFVPSNHLHLGYPIVMPRREVFPIDMRVEDAIKFFVSCGVLLQGPIALNQPLAPPQTPPQLPPHVAAALHHGPAGPSLAKKSG